MLIGTFSCEKDFIFFICHKTREGENDDGWHHKIKDQSRIVSLLIVIVISDETSYTSQ